MNAVLWTAIIIAGLAIVAVLVVWAVKKSFVPWLVRTLIKEGLVAGVESWRKRRLAAAQPIARPTPVASPAVTTTTTTRKRTLASRTGTISLLVGIVTFVLLLVWMRQSPGMMAAISQTGWWLGTGALALALLAGLAYLLYKAAQAKKWGLIVTVVIAVIVIYGYNNWWTTSPSSGTTLVPIAPIRTEEVLATREWSEVVEVPMCYRAKWQRQSPVAYEIMTQTGEVIDYPRDLVGTKKVRGKLESLRFRVTDPEQEAVVIKISFSPL
ncbi:MAG: hypothetical protein UY47_C0001G0049 [Parcubacteria group bacterium GW2011_GWB1_49_7]|nr:MAG: hypothetical protein UY47_C0001G0049 [Parcubacteria group bacterium GW2011_GWB1_49_7]